MKTLCGIVTGALLVCTAAAARAQAPAPAPAPTPTPPATASDDTRTQYPAFMANSYIDFNVGAIGYLFSSTQLQPGFQADSIDKPRLAVRADFFGHRFTKHLSAQVTYMRPARFVTYHNINGNNAASQTSLAYAGLTMVTDWSLSHKVGMYVEGGYGVTSRSGITVEQGVALAGAHYAAGLVGGGFSVHMTPNIDWMFGATYSPGRQEFEQPSTRLYTTGIRYHMRPLPEEEVAANRDAGNFFPTNTLRVGLTSNFAGYGANTFFSSTFPIFWGGNVETEWGFTLDYQRNVFHTKKLFAFDLGGSIGYWQSNLNHEAFRTFSAYPLLRFFLARPSSADIYFSYSLAGPTYISRSEIDGRDTGAAFTFQDFMGVGAYLGESRKLNVELGIKHFSNGNLAINNASIRVPLTLTFGVTF